MTTPTAGQVGGQDSGTSSTSGLPVPSMQRTIGGSPSAAEFRHKARHEVQTVLAQARESPVASMHKKMPCPLVFHSQPVRSDRLFSGWEDKCGYCGESWAAKLFAGAFFFTEHLQNKAKHLLGNSQDGSTGARYKNQGNMKACEHFSLEDKKQLLGDMRDAIDIIGLQAANKNGWSHFKSSLEAVVENEQRPATAVSRPLVTMASPSPASSSTADSPMLVGSLPVLLSPPVGGGERVGEGGREGMRQTDRLTDQPI